MIGVELVDSMKVWTGDFLRGLTGGEILLVLGQLYRFFLLYFVNW